ncbi:hypothetical protein Athai_22800 [Actinocatenispora thailandica]|uniref:Sulfatase N-terminal domain-containing protein n=1 Tax=Actinocatenispora thailandica TaxID=227318 RepID=A0A7R7HW71_9ACTN|nr:sulfatase-like hydrolase/transferase [Actinocatenispora thailandica]BCJ34777.1 hypothetical protein Athai_22800 [Actinocatenispora thailandica]
MTIAEVLGAAGYGTYLSGKWHLSSDLHTPNGAWPTRRGFDEFYGTLEGAGSYFGTRTLTRGETNIEAEAADPDFYYTDAISDNAAGFIRGHHRDRAADPLFLYLAYTAPHWPLHARQQDVDRYAGRFDEGWDVLRGERMRRLVESGVLDRGWAISDRDPAVPAWDSTDDHAWQAARMAVYAAQIDRMDQGIGRVLDALEQTGRLANTLFVFLSDNGGCAEEMPVETVRDFITGFVAFDETTRAGDPVRPGNSPEILPGGEDTYATYGREWANLSNTPFREYKHWVHEGGIATPLIAHWPAGLGTEPRIVHGPHQLPDVMATVLELTGAPYPAQYQGRDVLPPEGTSMLPTWRGEQPPDRTLYWEHEGNAAVRRGRWKLVRKYPGAGNCTTSTPTAPSCTTWPARTPRWWPTSPPTTSAGRTAAACCPASRSWHSTSGGAAPCPSDPLPDPPSPGVRESGSRHRPAGVSGPVHAAGCLGCSVAGVAGCLLPRLVGVRCRRLVEPEEFVVAVDQSVEGTASGPELADRVVAVDHER